MARFENINYLEFGKYIRELISDPDRIAAIKAGQIDIKEDLKGFMTPRGVSWNEITIIPHFDTANQVNIAFPFTGDVEGSMRAFAPDDGEGDEYSFPEHYDKNPNAGGSQNERKENRRTAYLSRIGDYVMSRCK